MERPLIEGEDRKIKFLNQIIKMYLEHITLDFRDVDLEKQPELKGIVDLKNDTKAAADYVRKLIQSCIQIMKLC